MKDFVSILDSHMSRKQVRNTINLLVEQGILSKDGIGSGTIYYLSENYINNSIIISKALEIGIEELKKRGEIEQNQRAKKRPKNIGYLTEIIMYDYVISLFSII